MNFLREKKKKMRKFIKNLNNILKYKKNYYNNFY